MKLDKLIALLQEARQKIGRDIEVSAETNNYYNSDIREIEDVEVEARVVRTITYVNGQQSAESEVDSSKVTVVVG